MSDSKTYGSAWHQVARDEFETWYKILSFMRVIGLHKYVRRIQIPVPRHWIPGVAVIKIVDGLPVIQVDFRSLIAT